MSNLVFDENTDTLVGQTTGWRAWSLYRTDNSMLRCWSGKLSPNIEIPVNYEPPRFVLSSPMMHSGVWPSRRRFEAKCQVASSSCKKQGGKPCRIAPEPECSCGFYAMDNPTSGMLMWDVIGEVYGWGKVVRCSKGFRTQYAYPKSLYVVGHFKLVTKYTPMDICEQLRLAYGVPAKLGMFDSFTRNYDLYFAAYADNFREPYNLPIEVRDTGEYAASITWQNPYAQLYVDNYSLAC